MNLILALVVLFVVFGGGGYYGRSSGYYGVGLRGYWGGGLGLILLVLIVLWLCGVISLPVRLR